MKKLKLFYLGILAVIISACHPKNDENKVTSSSYFDVKSFFEKEATKLNQQKPTILKSVGKDEVVEQKRLKIKDWKKELKSFIDADINKASWQNEFQTSTTEEVTTYTSANDKISVKKLIVARQGDSVIYIKAIVNNINFLYTSKDTLTYYPGKFYEMRKSQKIKLFSAVSYQIKGLFN